MQNHSAGEALLGKNARVRPMSIAWLTHSPEALCYPIWLSEDPKVKNGNADQPADGRAGRAVAVT